MLYVRLRVLDCLQELTVLEKLKSVLPREQNSSMMTKTSPEEAEKGGCNDADVSSTEEHILIKQKYLKCHIVLSTR